MPSFISQLITSKAVPGSGDHLHGPAGAHSPIASTATATTAASATPNGSSTHHTTGLPPGFGGAGFGGLGGLGATGFGGLGGIGASPAGGLTGATRLPIRSNLGLPMGLQMPLTFPTNAPMGTNSSAPGVTPIIPMIPNMKRGASTRELKPRSSGSTVVDTRSAVSSSSDSNTVNSSSDSAATTAAPSSPPPSSIARTTAPTRVPTPATAVVEPATDPATPSDDSGRMSWNDTQKMQDFFLHIKDPENFVQAENKLINIRELMAKNASPLERFEASQHTKDFSKKPSSGGDDDDGVSSSASTSASTSASASPVPAPAPVAAAPPMRDNRSAGSPHSALADMLAARSGRAATPAKPERSNQDDNDRSPETDRSRSKNALAEMLAKRNGGTAQQQSPQTPKKTPPAGDARGNMLAEMLAKRGGGGPQQPAPSTPVAKPKAAPAGDARGNMLAEMLAKRGGGDEQPSPKPKPSGDARGNMLAEMLAKRGGGGGEPSAPATPEKPKLPSSSSPSPLKKSEKSNPLLAMIAKRKASQPSPQSKGENAAANPLAAMLQRRLPPPAAGNPQESEHQAPQQPSLPPSPAKSGATEVVALKDDPQYAQYFKMLKIGHPPPVVKHRMQRDGVDPAILDCDPSKPLPSVLPGQSTEDAEAEREFQAQLAEYNEKVGKYTQMLKVGLPRPVVEHKMRMEGVDAAWLDGPPKKKVPVAAPPKPTEAEIALHREKYGKYFAMLRVGLPRGAVEHKMQMAGIDPKELDGPHPVAAPGASSAGSSPATGDAKSLKRTNSIRKKIHWEVKNHPAHKRTGSRDSLWNFPMVDDSLLGEIQVSRESKEMLEKLFVKDLTEERARAKKLSGAKKPGSASPGDDAKKKQQLIVLIDMKKSQNIAITLARVKLSFPELKREILAMNPTVLSTAQLQSLMDMWPDRTEQQAIDNFRGDMNLLGSTEKFLVETRNVPRFKEKLACLVFKQEFPTRVHELRESIKLIIRGVNQVCESHALRQLFIYILQIGNFLNFGTEGMQTTSVGGFSLNSLVKLSQTKAFVGGITFLHYVVQSIERDVPHLARFYDQISLSTKCSKVSLSVLQSEKKSLDDGLKMLQAEANAEVPADVADAALATSIVKHFATEVEHELEALDELLNEMEASKAHFLEYFEEEETGEELDVLFGHIANFTDEYQREHKKFLEAQRQERLKELKKQAQAMRHSMSMPRMPPTHSRQARHSHHGHSHRERSQSRSHHEHTSTARPAAASESSESGAATRRERHSHNGQTERRHHGLVELRPQPGESSSDARPRTRLSSSSSSQPTSPLASAILNSTSPCA